MTTLQQLSSSQSSPEVPINENFETLGASAIFGKKQPTTSGLTWGYYGGLYNGNVIPDGTLTLTDASTNYVVVLRSSGVVSVSTTNANSIATAYAKLYQLTTAGAVVTSVVDQRMDANGLLVGGGSGGGGGGGSGTVTSVAASVPGFLSIAGSPITSAGTLVIDYSGTALPIANGGTGTKTPSLVQGTNVTITGAWPNQTINAIGGSTPSPSSTVTTLTSSSGAVNIDCSLGDYFVLSLTENISTITFSNLPGSGKGASKFIEIVQGSGPYTVAWPGSFTWQGGMPVTVSTTLSIVDELAITTLSNGATWKATLGKAWS